MILDAASKVEHYEIATYRALVTGAQQVGNAHALRILQIILEQEERMAELLDTNGPPIIERIALSETNLPLTATALAQSMNT